MKKLFKNSITILVYVKQLDSTRDSKYFDSIMQINNNIQIDFTLFNKDFEKIVLFKNVKAVNLKNKLSLDENSVVKLVCMHMIFTLY